MRRLAAPAVLCAVLASFLFAQPAHAIDRATAATSVINSVILPHPRSTTILAFGPQVTIPGGTQLYDGFASRPLAVVGATSWLFWIDSHPLLRYGHPTTIVLVNASTGVITTLPDGQFWPRYGGIDHYRNSVDRTNSSPDLIYVGPNVYLAPQPGPSRMEQLRRFELLAPDPAAGKWTLIICGEDPTTNPDFKADVDSATVISGLLGVPAGNLTTVTNATELALCNAIAAMPKKCPKLYVFVIAHGDPLEFVTNGETVTSAAFAGKLKSLGAGEYCTFLQQCFAGSFLQALKDSSIVGLHVTAADSTHEAIAHTTSDAKFPWIGEVLLHYLTECMRAGKRGTPAYECARDSLRALIARANKQGAGLTDPVPLVAVTFKDTLSGQATTFRVPSGTGSVCISWKPGAAGACGNASVYCEVIENLVTKWKLVKDWDWNLNSTKYFNPNAPGATGNYKLVSHANGYPDCGDIRFPATAVPETPSSPQTFAGGSLGWRDRSSAELWPFPVFGSNNYAPGLTLDNVPRDVGTTQSGNVPLVLSFPLQTDPGRPWLYVNGNPAQGINGRVTVETAIAGLFDPLGQPASSMQLQLDFYQGPTHRVYFINGQDTPQGFVSTPIDLGLVLPQPFQVVLHAPGTSPQDAQGPGGGFFRLDAFIINMETFGTVSAPPTVLPATPELSAARPNPFVGATAVQLSLPSAQRVRARVIDVTGREVRLIADRVIEAGVHPLAWDGRNEALEPMHAGVYFMVIETSAGRSSRKLVLAK